HRAGAELGDARQLGHVGHALGELLDGQELAEVEVVADLDQFVFPARTHGVADLPYEQAEGRAGADGGGGHGGEDTRLRNICKRKYCQVSNRGPPGVGRGGQGRRCGGGYNRRPFSAFRSARMFESLTQRLSGTLERLRGRGRLTESNISEAVREVRIALLEADVALPVVQALIQRIKVRAVGQEVLKSLTPGQALIKVVRDELTAVMGSSATDLNLNVPAPAVFLMAGLQGAGKTTTVGK